MVKITSYDELIKLLPQDEKVYLLLYKKGSEQSECAYKNLLILTENEETLPLFSVDVTMVRDVHVKYGIRSVPTLMIFEKGEFTREVKGCHESSYYKSVFQNAIYQAKAKAEGKVPKRVTVYSTPTCSWCNTLKSWLRRNGIPYRDVDVSRDEREAQELVRRSGQQGVPQTDINGQIVVGFNEQRLKTLLEI